MSIKKFWFWVGDCVARITGYAAVRDWTPSAGPGEFVLKIPNYTQINSYSCGVVAGFQVVKSFYPEAEFGHFYATVDPCEETGTSIRKLIQSLRQFGVSVKRERRMTKTSLVKHLRKGSPVIVCIRNPASENYHWVVAHGFSERYVFLTNNGAPWLPFRRRTTWEHFNQIWRPSGNGLVCRA